MHCMTAKRLRAVKAIGRWIVAESRPLELPEATPASPREPGAFTFTEQLLFRFAVAYGTFLIDVRDHLVNFRHDRLGPPLKTPDQF